MFAIEVVAPFGIFLGRWPRRLACAAIVLFQLLIAATGNYGFFNLLTIVLCLALLEDSVWARIGRSFGRLFVWLGWKRAPGSPPESPRAVAGPSWVRWPWWVTVPAGLFLVVLTFMAGMREVTPELAQDPASGARSLVYIGGGAVAPGGGGPQWAWADRFLVRPLTAVHRWSVPFRSTNGYGLFRVMTRRRPEVVVEGSSDGRTWKAYEFKWKPGDPHRRPQFATPHMPRLDWQIWTPFLGQWGDQMWLINLEGRLLKGTPEVVGLLDRNPFPNAPPKYVRIVAYEYRFTTTQERARTGDWWVRYTLGVYGPPLTLDPESGEPMVAGEQGLLLE
jgi:hypothetical protein